MTEREKIIDLLIKHEAERLKPYVDTRGKMTIGIGRNLTDNGISREESRVLCDHDIDEAILDLATFPWFVALDTVRQRALIDLRFALGPSRFRGFVLMIAALARKDYRRASAELQASDWALEVQPSRVAQLRLMLDTGLDEMTV